MPSGVTVAATLTSVVSLPNVATVRGDRGLGARLVGDIDRERVRAAAAGDDGAGHRFRLGRVEIGDRDLGAFGGEAPRDRAADLAAAAGDQTPPPLRQPGPRYAAHQFVAACTKLPSKIADFGGNGFFMVPISSSPSAIFS